VLFFASTLGGIAVLGSNLYVTDELNDRVSEYTTSGDVVNLNVITGLGTPHGIVVVPEPSTLILAALGGLALLAWRWRRSAC
jgi:hypothetical protein